MYAFFFNQTAATITLIFLLTLLESYFHLTSGGTPRGKQGLKGKGAVWMRRSIGCVPSLWKPLHRQTQGQKVCLCLPAFTQPGFIMSWLSVSLENMLALQFLGTCSNINLLAFLLESKLNLHSLLSWFGLGSS